MCKVKKIIIYIKNKSQKLTVKLGGNQFNEIDNRIRLLEGEEPISNRRSSSIPSPEYSSIPPLL